MTKKLATFTKLSTGAWGVRLTGYSAMAYELITITLKDGTRKAVEVGERMWSRDGIEIWSIHNIYNKLEVSKPKPKQYS